MGLPGAYQGLTSYVAAILTHQYPFTYPFVDNTISINHLDPGHQPADLWCGLDVLYVVINLDRTLKHFRDLGLKRDGAAIRKWYRDKEKTMNAQPHQRRLLGGGRKPLSMNMEDMLYDLVIDKRLRKEKVTREWIADQALVCHASLHADDDAPPPFAASQHWVSSFMARYSLSLRRRTNLTTLSDEALVGRAVSYMRYLRDLTPKMDKEHTVLMAETAVYFEDACTQTVDLRGARQVVVRSTGYASIRITALLAVTASGRKLPPGFDLEGQGQTAF
ncbi:unnamed protein product [Phytophthora fragariaefolia]|uniref:Unnamed protein product n=1 Tax=Phytophthora fragariaefolia TaxID=1490495 RepID=A0A9W6WWS8_9STRA|nr:unnamed protein product [Phytophthora fragariaefolia]